MFGGTLLFHIRIADLCFAIHSSDAGIKHKLIYFFVVLFSQLIGFASVFSTIYLFGAVTNSKENIDFMWVSIICIVLVTIQGARKRKHLKGEKVWRFW